jgi:hypothetical protein
LWARERPEAGNLINHQEVTMTDKRRAFEEKLEAQMKEWNAKIDLLKAKTGTDKVWGEAKSAFHDAAAKLKCAMPNDSEDVAL